MLIDVQIGLTDWFNPVEKHFIKTNKKDYYKLKGRCSSAFTA